MPGCDGRARRYRGVVTPPDPVLPEAVKARALLDAALDAGWSGQLRRGVDGSGHPVVSVSVDPPPGRNLSAYATLWRWRGTSWRFLRAVEQVPQGEPTPASLVQVTEAIRSGDASGPPNNGDADAPHGDRSAPDSA